MMKSKFKHTLLGATTVLLLAACGGGDDNGSSSSSGGDAAGGGGAPADTTAQGQVSSSFATAFNQPPTGEPVATVSTSLPPLDPTAEPITIP